MDDSAVVVVVDVSAVVMVNAGVASISSIGELL